MSRLDIHEGDHLLLGSIGTLGLDAVDVRATSVVEDPDREAIVNGIDDEQVPLEKRKLVGEKVEHDLTRFIPGK